MIARFYTESRKCHDCWVLLVPNTYGTRCEPCAEAKRRQDTAYRLNNPKPKTPPRKDLSLWRYTGPGPLMASMGMRVGRDEVRMAA